MKSSGIAPAFEALQRQADALYVVGTFISMIRSDDALPFNERAAQRLMKISEHPVLTNTTHETHLPTTWTTDGAFFGELVGIARQVEQGLS